LGGKSEPRSDCGWPPQNLERGIKRGGKKGENGRAFISRAAYEQDIRLRKGGEEQNLKGIKKHGGEERFDNINIKRKSTDLGGSSKSHSARLV